MQKIAKMFGHIKYLYYLCALNRFLRTYAVCFLNDLGHIFIALFTLWFAVRDFANFRT